MLKHKYRVVLHVIVLLATCWAAAQVSASQPPAPGSELPNVVIIFADDLGYGDLGCYGHPTIRTPQLDRMAAEGMRLTQCYAGASACTPSRAALLTGRLPIRSGMAGRVHRVLFPASIGGLPDNEITLAEALKTKGYKTACIGKWHLGHLPQYAPMRHGFDSFYGIPYSNDMSPRPLMRNDEVLEEPADLTSLTRRYTDEAIKFITAERDGPFFLYLPHTMPHTPLNASARFKGKSPRGLYGDVVEELDWSTGEIMRTLRDLDLAERTLVLFSSDNGPWLIRKEDGGSAGLLREGKGCTYEGGMRVPGLAWWPGKIPAGIVSSELTSSMDFYATVHALAGIEPPNDRELDSYDLTPLLLGKGPSARREMFYYRQNRLMAVRLGPWKAHYLTQPAYTSQIVTPHDPPELYNLDEDPSERFDRGRAHADVVRKIDDVVRAHRAKLVIVPSQLDKTK